MGTSPTQRDVLARWAGLLPSCGGRWGLDFGGSWIVFICGYGLFSRLVFILRIWAGYKSSSSRSGQLFRCGVVRKVGRPAPCNTAHAEKGGNLHALSLLARRPTNFFFSVFFHLGGFPLQFAFPAISDPSDRRCFPVPAERPCRRMLSRARTAGRRRDSTPPCPDRAPWSRARSACAARISKSWDARGWRRRRETCAFPADSRE